LVSILEAQAHAADLGLAIVHFHISFFGKSHADYIDPLDGVPTLEYWLRKKSGCYQCSERISYTAHSKILSVGLEVWLKQ
jgi:hypothetical protein